MAQPTIAKSPEDVSNEGPENSFIIINSSRPSNAEPQSCSGPDPPPNPAVTRRIMNGLKIRLKDQTTVIASYTYALLPRMEKYVPVDWKILVTDDVQSHHIRCHELQDGDELSMLVSNFKDQHAKAVILINTQNNYSIVPQFLENMKKNTIPMVVITQSDGAILLNILDTNRENVEARLDAESDVDGEGQEDFLLPGQYTGAEPSIQRQRVNNDPGMMEELMKLMFSADKRPVLVSNDRGRFILVMATLTNHEKLTKEDNNHATVNEALKRMKPHTEKLFNKDLPFYLMFAYRLHHCSKFYQCEKMVTFITACLEKIEKLNYKELARTINNFAKRGDFQVMCGTAKEEECVSMFLFMERACQVLSELSENLNRRAAAKRSHERLATNVTQVVSNFCYTKIMWLSLALKFHYERTQDTRASPRVWYDTFFNHRIILTDTVLKDLVDGMDFIRLLYLPKELYLTFQHMTDLVVSETSIQQFENLQKFLSSMEHFLETDDDLIHMLIQIRAKHIYKMKEPGFSMAKVSIKGTLADTITEVLSFLEFLLSVWNSCRFTDKSIDSECTNWLQLLLGLVDITQDHSHTLLKKFFGKTGICKKYQTFIKQQILKITYQHFDKLSIQQFFTLYKTFRIWPNEFLREYLKSYKVPLDTKINDGTCKEFFGEVVDRFPTAHEHYYLLDFLMKISERYCEDKCAESFVLDLIRLRVPKLLRVPDQGSSEDADIDRARDIQRKFIVMLTNYIHGNALKKTILQQITDILNAISDERDEFQQLILGVLYQEVIPEFKVLQELDSNNGTSSQLFKTIIEYSIDYLCKSLSWLQALTAKQTFCWGLVASSFSRVHVTAENFQWLHNYLYEISQLGKLFNTYCTQKKLFEKQSVIINDLPDDIAKNCCDDITRYFKWISTIQYVFQTWKRKLESQDINYDEIFMYANCQNEIERLCETLCCTTLVIDFQCAQTVKNSFLTDFELLNVYLLRYIPQHPDAKWCNFLVILREYGVALPQHLLTLIKSYVVFPDDKSRSKDEFLKHPLPAKTNGQFQPGSNELSLRLTNRFTLKKLSELVRGIKEFQDILIADIGMLIFFKLNHSVMFDKYLRVEIEQAINLEAEQAKKEPAFELSMFKFSSSQSMLLSSKKKKHTVSVDVLEKSLHNTSKLLIKIMRGEATYDDIIAQGKLDLETLDIENELTTLKSYFLTSNVTQSESKGLDGVRSLLELLQYTKHIQKIQDVCKQYDFIDCLNDSELKEIKSLVRDVESKGNRSKLTPKEASKRMKRIKTVLCLESDCKSKVRPRNNLEVFSAVADSAEFYKFIRDNQFYGEKGQITFHQQYQLVTAQLQHEEYDESVLNHLLAAFNVMTPFLDQKQKFKQLMTKVTRLDTTRLSIGLKQLETVNGNITLISLWFSRAEGDTLQNIAKELDTVLETGYYLFKLPMDGEAQMILEYVPSSFQTSNAFEEGRDGGGTTVCSRASFSQTSKLEPQTSDLDRSMSKRSKPEQWNSEQIGDFVRKLGFMDAEREGGEKIKHFRHISSIAYHLLELYRQLKDLGNPLYFKGTVEPLFCGIDRTNADARVRETEVNLESWKKLLTELRSKYGWLLFFSIPKILRLYTLVSVCEGRHEQLDEIVAEISFLCQNDEASRQNLKQRVKRELKNCQKDVRHEEPPMHTIGQFLSVLFWEHPLPKRSNSSPLLRTRSLTCFSLSHDFTQLLHYCPQYSQSQLILTLVGICSGVPEAFEMFRCRPSTTKDELTLFLKRAASHSLHSFVLEVNKLPFKLQESLMQLHLLVQTTQCQEDDPEEVTTLAATRASPCIHFIETEPSVLRDVPWIQLREHTDTIVTFEEAQKVCHARVLLPENFICIQLVVGAAGDGKTHYIKEQLETSDAKLTIAVNEAFTPLKAIKKLCSLPTNVWRAAIFFNFTMLSPGDSVGESVCERYKQLMEVIGWFFFDLLILGYVEDPFTGRSFRIPGGLQWAIYIEVPSRAGDMSSEEALKQFCEEVPTLGLLGKKHFIFSDKPYRVDDDVQLVCKYLQAYDTGGNIRIDRLFRESGKRVKFSEDPDILPHQCQELLQKYMPEHIRSTKITQRLFVKYMKRRCEFLDNLPAFNYNTGVGEYLVNEQGQKVITITHQLGSTLMRTMLKEVSDFCDPKIKDNWSKKPHQQLIYDYKDCGASFGLISLHPEKLSESEKEAFRKIGIKIPSMADLFSRNILDLVLSRALNIQLEKNRLVAIDDSAYVLTLDYTIKMLNIHERYECGIPVIVEGETGVGKTALIEMLSILWNHSLLLEWKKQQDRMVDFFVCKMRKLPISVVVWENYQACVQTVQSMNAGEYVSEDKLIMLCQLYDETGQLFSVAQSYLNKMRNYPVVAYLTLNGTQHRGKVPLEQLFLEAEVQKTPKATAILLHAVLCARTISTFHKINVHAAMTPSDIQEHFKPAFNQARELSVAYKKELQTPVMATHDPVIVSSRIPFVTVLLDEVNTSSCVGLFKEIIVDRTLDGEPIPDNVFIVAACNPHRGNSMASLGVEDGSKKDKWVRGTYYVRKLHPTLRFLMWDYGSLDEHQEKEYINTKMKMLNQHRSNSEVASLAKVIVGSQNRMRHYAFEQICANNRRETESFARISSRSCVSQRDIQRVFTLYQWFIKIYNKQNPHKLSDVQIKHQDYSRRAVLVAVGIVYYMRLNNHYRQEYARFLDSEYRPANEITFTRAFEEELDWYIRLVKLPKGIAHTRALKENIFATIVCTVTHTPLIIVGAPGSSKTLSFNQTIANLKGAESRQKIFQDTTIFPSLDPHYYQCSRRTTSNEIQTVFSRAINRQRSHAQFNLPIYCVVFMDEAGLPEESHESLKVLHYHLDKQEVSFVAITNHVLDAAKTNRAVSLFRPEVLNDDLLTLAKGCFYSNPEDPLELELDLKNIVKFCAPYSTLMENKEFARFYGLRDFIQFVNFLRRKRQSISHKVVMQALERNFNGSEDFDTICATFLGANLANVKRRGILEILRASLADRPQEKQDLGENEVRYKLIIDPSEDDSLVRLLFTFGILKRDNTRIFVCSNFPADKQLQKINTIAAIRHSAIEGHTVVMSQTDDIHESFYDLFNQRFRKIDDLNEGPRYYTNIAIGAHLRPSRVHHNFQCVVVVKKSEVVNTPAPFLNRFEKYLITHQTMLETALNLMPHSIASIIRAAMEKVQEFVDIVSGSDSLYGLCPHTLSSLILSLLPAIDHIYPEIGELSLVDNSQDVRSYIIKEIVQAFRECSGLFIPKFSIDEFKLDVDAVFKFVLQDPKFKSLMKEMTHNAASLAIPEAINVLHMADRVDHLDVTPKGCLVIALLQQWLVRFLTKRLMQIMTSEALILHRNKIPFSYLNNYLNFHTHFSLLKLVESYHQAVESTRQDLPTCCSATKVLCYTRSSPLIHQLPAEFPCPYFGIEMESIARNILKIFVFVETNKLVMYKLSSILSQTTIQDFIRNFLDSKTAEVCLLVVNMHETTKEMVNHVRIMIEEAENLSTIQMTKIFVMLLHFPPSQFYKTCYPSLFLKGWDHCYLDTIAHSTVQGVVDIRDWFWQCCFPNQSSQLEEDTLLQALLGILPQSIPVLAARVFFGSRQNSSFNSTMKGHERSVALKELLLKKGRDGITVGRILCEKFRAYWKPGVMAKHLEKAAVFSRNRESTLNITESIQTNFKSLFFDFLVYMVSKINENYNIDIIFDADCSETVQDVFFKILKVFPTPKFSLLSDSLPQLKPLVYTPKFPFFQTVCDTMEKVVELSKKEANMKLDILSDVTTPPDSSLDWAVSPQDILSTLQQAISNTLTQKMEGKQVLEVVAKAISNDIDLWNMYFIDFILHKLRLDSEGGIAQQMLYTFMRELHSLEALERVINLHAYLHVYQLDLAKLASNLRPLNKLHKLRKDTPTIQSTSLSHKLFSVVQQNQFPFGSPEHLATFVVTTLFDALAGFLYSSEKSQIDINDDVRIWHNVYRDVMTLPNLKQNIYSTLGVGTEIGEVEGRLNIMQTTFLVLQISPDLNQDEETVMKGQHVFRTLFSRHFDDTMEMKTECPRLCAVVHVLLEVTSQTATGIFLNASRILLEGLFAHFFSPERGNYHPDDIRWFLELANCQKEWGSSQLDEKWGVLSADLSDDLVTQLEQSLMPGITKMADGVTSMNIFKLYLGQILGQRDSRLDSTANSDPLQLYHQYPRSEIGAVLISHPELRPPGPFIPTFYKECTFIKSSTETHMQQPLAHLYFLTVLEHLMSKPCELSDFIEIATSINTLCTSTSDKFKAVLYIELQAVTQVIAQQLALHLDPYGSTKFTCIKDITLELNGLLDDDITGGGPEGGHGMVVALHLLKMLKSPQKFTDLFDKKYKTERDLKKINCLEPFYRKTPSVSCAHYLLLMMPDADGDMEILFDQVVKIMVSIHNGKNTEALKTLATECAQSSKRSLKVPAAQHTDRRKLFRMMVWLVAYYEYYCKKIPSKVLCDAIGHQDLAPYLKEEGYVRMIQCFLLPELMIQQKETPRTLREYEVVPEQIPDMKKRPIRREGNEVDPVYELFMPSNLEQQGIMFCHRSIKNIYGRNWRERRKQQKKYPALLNRVTVVVDE